jgi:hypothetical protein
MIKCRLQNTLLNLFLFFVSLNLMILPLRIQEKTIVAVSSFTSFSSIKLPYKNYKTTCALRG